MSFKELIDRWPSRAALADDCGVDYGVVKQWHRRDSIPSKHWPVVIASARKHKLRGVTLQKLSDISRGVLSHEPRETRQPALQS